MRCPWRRRQRGSGSTEIPLDSSHRNRERSVDDVARLAARRGLLRRGARHTLLGACATALILAILPLAPRPRLSSGLSLATAWVGLLFFAATLIIGPLNLLRRRANPVSGYLRRDVGIWAGILATAHTLFGLTVHLDGDWPSYFVWPRPS